MSLSLQSLPDLDRYEQFQTFSGLSNHALADLVNAIICVSFYTIYTFWEASSREDFSNLWQVSLIEFIPLFTLARFWR